MADIVSSEKRSQMMAGIKGKNTKPELVVRRALHALGFRYRVHYKFLHGKPDLVFPKYKAVIFIHGCFWHGHDCQLFKLPATRREFWLRKISRNKEVDTLNSKKLEKLGWRIGTIWECSLRGKRKQTFSSLISDCSIWLKSSSKYFNARGI